MFQTYCDMFKTFSTPLGNGLSQEQLRDKEASLKCGYQERISNVKRAVGIIQYFSSVFLTIQSSLAVVVNDSVVSLLEELDGGEPLDLHVLQLIGSGVHLGDDNAANRPMLCLQQKEL